MDGPIDYLIWLGAAELTGQPALNVGQRQLSDLYLAGLPVLPGFVLTADLLVAHLQQPAISRLLTKQLLAIDWQKTKTIASASKQLTNAVNRTVLPADLRHLVEAAYQQLQERYGRGPVLLEAALVGHDLPPFELHPPLPANNSGQLLKAINLHYASLFRPQNLTPPAVEDLLAGHIGLSLLIQPLLATTHSGRLTTGNPIKVEAVYGRPEPLLEGLLTPDNYELDANALTVVSRDLNRQEWQVVDLQNSHKHQKIGSLDQTSQKIDDEQLMELAKLALMMDHQSDWPRQAVWQVDRQGKTWLTGLVDLAEIGTPYNLPPDPAQAQRLAIGKGVTIGLAAGPLRLVGRRTDLEAIETNAIILAESADSLPVELISRVSGVILETGQPHQPFIQLAQEHGLPVVISPQVRHRLKDGQVVTIDGRSGLIYRGRVTPQAFVATLPKSQLVTGTKILALVDRLDELDQLAGAATDGIGLLSSKAVFARINRHPRQLLKNDQSHYLLTELVDSLTEVAARFRPRPLIYVLNDLTSAEYRQLIGGEAHETLEDNPLLGYRGLHRSLQEPDLLRLELEAVRQVREDYGHPNLHLMLPYVRTKTEFTAAVRMITGAGLKPGADFRLWLLCQLPATLTLLKNLTKSEAIQGVCLDVDSLTQLILGADHTNPRLVNEYDIRDESVMEALETSIHLVRQAGLPVTVVGQSLNRYPEAIEALVGAGVTGLVVEPEIIFSTRQLVASAEKRLLLDHIVEA